MSFMPVYSETQDTQQTPTAVFFGLFSLAFLALISLLLVLPAVVNATIKKKKHLILFLPNLKRERNFPGEKLLYVFCF